MSRSTRIERLEQKRPAGPSAPRWQAIGFYDAETRAIVSPVGVEQQRRITVWLPMKDADGRDNPDPLPAWVDDLR